MAVATFDGSTKELRFDSSVTLVPVPGGDVIHIRRRYDAEKKRLLAFLDEQLKSFQHDEKSAAMGILGGTARCERSQLHFPTPHRDVPQDRTVVVR